MKYLLKKTSFSPAQWECLREMCWDIGCSFGECWPHLTPPPTLLKCKLVSMHWSVFRLVLSFYLKYFKFLPALYCIFHSLLISPPLSWSLSSCWDIFSHTHLCQVCCKQSHQLGGKMWKYMSWKGQQHPLCCSPAWLKSSVPLLICTLLLTILYKKWNEVIFSGLQFIWLILFQLMKRCYQPSLIVFPI